MPKLYDALAPWWPLLSPPDEYTEEGTFFRHVLMEAGLPPEASLVEFGCGGGSVASHLKQSFLQVTLTDLSPAMLAVSQALNPECAHVAGDMRTLRLGGCFDVVLIHDAIDYMTTHAALRQVVETAFVHCQPGGLALLVPDYVRETFQPTTDHGGQDGPGRSLRYLEWTYDPDAHDTTYTTEYVYLLREGSYPTQVEYDQHICGLFARAEWLALLEDVGFLAEVIHDPFDREVFLARKPPT